MAAFNPILINSCGLIPYYPRAKYLFPLESKIYISRPPTNIGDTIHSSANVNSSLSGLKCSNKEEADGRIILHLKDMVRHGSQNVVVRTVDTDVLVLCIAFYSRLKSLGLQNLWVLFGTGAKRRYLSAHLMAGKSL